MPVPTYPSAITLVDIQTEFGGSNPISLSEYYAGGTYVGSGTANATSVAIPTSGAINLLHFSGAQAGAIVNPLTPVSGTYENTENDTYNGINIIVYRNGSVGIESEWGTNLGSGYWFFPTRTDIGDTHWVRFTRTAFGHSGYGGATANTGWQQLNLPRACGVWTYEDAGSTENAVAVFTVEIATASGGSPIVTSRTALELDVTTIG